MANKSTKPVRLPEPDKNEQILRAIAMKRESFFQLILGNLLHQQGMGPKEAVDLSIEAADYAIEKLYPIKQEAK